MRLYIEIIRYFNNLIFFKKVKYNKNIFNYHLLFNYIKSIRELKKYHSKWFINHSLKNIKLLRAIYSFEPNNSFVLNKLSYGNIIKSGSIMSYEEIDDNDYIFIQRCRTVIKGDRFCEYFSNTCYDNSMINKVYQVKLNKKWYPSIYIEDVNNGDYDFHLGTFRKATEKEINDYLINKNINDFNNLENEIMNLQYKISELNNNLYDKRKVINGLLKNN
jgi:hypothetical protein